MSIWGQKSSGAVPFGTFYALSASVVVHPALTYFISAPPRVFLSLFYSLNMSIWGQTSSGAFPLGTTFDSFGFSLPAEQHPLMNCCLSVVVYYPYPFISFPAA